MGQYYGKLPSELLDLPLDDFLLDYWCWYYHMDHERQQQQAAETRAMAAREQATQSLEG